MRSLWLLLGLGLLALSHVQASTDIADELLDEDLDLSDIDENEEEFLRLLEEKNKIKDIERENEIATKLAEVQHNLLNPVVEVDLCETMSCGAGRICQMHNEKPKCVCIPECPEEVDTRRLVCTNTNETWPSDCSVYQQRCWCDSGEPGCTNPDNAHMHIDYYGACHEPRSCEGEDLKDFPRRMRDWLFNVMRDLAERDELTEHYMQMELEAETNNSRRWSNAAVWKWCDLDGDTDRSVSRHELFPIRAPLVSLEHCIAPFLESCDSNKDHRITLVEWGACLELDPEDLKERCDDVQRAQPHLLG
ncbi:SPARC [Drosophila yakuba]|uniref:BM-40-SPARC n=2 Tax=Drosophila yakuba TaxID=7245 RepID=B4PSC2_DROYA|nr:SPARC [Drosophila yakuba]EDW98584.1 BM-40-SPARC [Drosophila yakuba]